MRPYSDLSDKALTSLLREGDETAFTELYRRYWQSMFNAAYKRLQDEAQAQDIVQNIFTDLWARKEKREIDNPAAFLHTAVRFQVIKLATRQPDQSYFLQNIEKTLASSGRADDALLEDEAQDLLKHWIAALPEKRREIFLLRYFNDCSTSDIAAQLEISQKTVQNQLNTASTALRTRLREVLSLNFLALATLLG